MTNFPQIVYCHCKYAAIVPENTKQEIIRYLTQSGSEFLAVPDLCEMASRCDPTMKSLASQENVIIIACYPRAVQALFESADAALKKGNTTVLNMRTETAESIIKTFPENK